MDLAFATLLSWNGPREQLPRRILRQSLRVQESIRSSKAGDSSSQTNKASVELLADGLPSSDYMNRHSFRLRILPRPEKASLVSISLAADWPALWLSQ